MSSQWKVSITELQIWRNNWKIISMRLSNFKFTKFKLFMILKEISINLLNLKKLYRKSQNKMKF